MLLASQVCLKEADSAVKQVPFHWIISIRQQVLSCQQQIASNIVVNALFPTIQVWNVWYRFPFLLRVVHLVPVMNTINLFPAGLTVTKYSLKSLGIDTNHPGTWNLLAQNTWLGARFFFFFYLIPNLAPQDIPSSFGNSISIQSTDAGKRQTTYSMVSSLLNYSIRLSNSFLDYLRSSSLRFRCLSNTTYLSFSRMSGWQVLGGLQL